MFTIFFCLPILVVICITFSTKSKMAEAFVSLATTDDYARGASVLGKSLKRSGTTRKTVIMITKNLSSNMK